MPRRYQKIGQNGILLILIKASWQNTQILTGVCRKQELCKKHNQLTKFPSPSDTTHSTNYGKYGPFWKKLENHPSPLFVATNGAHSTTTINTSSNIEGITKMDNKISSSFVICQAQITNENYKCNDDKHWTYLPSIPLLCRIAHLPVELGVHRSDIGHGEAFAIAMQEMTLPKPLPIIIITDSESTRNICMGIKNLSSYKKDRHLIRNLMGGISKSITGNILRRLNEFFSFQRKCEDTELKTLAVSLQRNMNTCIKEAIEWTKQNKLGKSGMVEI